MKLKNGYYAMNEKLQKAKFNGVTKQYLNFKLLALKDWTSLKRFQTNNEVER